MSSRLSRYWAESNLPRPMSPRPRDELGLALFACIGRVLYESREDPQRLATACAAWCRLGYPPDNWVFAMEHPPSSHPDMGKGKAWSSERCHEAAAAALKYKRRRDLTQRADGLIQAMVVLGSDADAWMRHQDQVEHSCRECRDLPIEERIQRWREQERREQVEREIGAWHDRSSERPGEGVEIHEYLGWTFDQYARYVERGELPVDDHRPHVSINEDGRYVSVGFDDTNDTILRVGGNGGDPGHHDVARAREWVATIRRMIKSRQGQEAHAS